LRVLSCVNCAWNHVQAEGGRFIVAISLAEAETLRRIIHTDPPALAGAAAAIRLADGRLVDRSRLFTPEVESAVGEGLVARAVLCMRFINNEVGCPVILC
jgi:hypothetical protein